MTPRQATGALREWVRRLFGTLGYGGADRELEEELRLHVQLAVEAERRRTVAADGAARAASIRSGGIMQTMDALRDQRGLPWLDDLARDVRYACRMLAASPGFTLVSVVSLAIGIGANCAVFSFADALLLRPLTVPRPSEVVTVGSTAAFGRSLAASYPDYADIRDRSTSFDGLVAFTELIAALTAEPRTPPTQRIGLLVSGNFFAAMGVKPALGRAFRVDEDLVTGRDAVVILGHDLWQRQFGADPSILGRAVRLNGVELTIIGVAPAAFTGLDRYTRYEFYVPLMMWPRVATDRRGQSLEARDFRFLNVKGRIKDGLSIEHAQIELSVIARDLERAYPDTNRNQGIVVRSELQDRMAKNPANVVIIAMFTLLAGAVLFAACANVAGLLASRAPMRAREIALRMAIGAGRRRVIRQLITESTLVAIAGGVGGLGVGYAGVRLFRQFQIPTELPIAVSFQLDRRALLVSLAIALTSAILFGLAPAAQATRADLTAVMKATDTAGFGRRRRWGRGILVAGQVAVSVVVLAVAVLVYRNFQQQVTNGPGFRTDHLLMMWFDPGRVQYTDAQARLFFDELVERARGVPGVKSVTLASHVPMDGGARPMAVAPEGFQFPTGTDSAMLASAVVDEHYFGTLGLPIFQGRGIAAGDSADAPSVAVVNEVAVERYWRGQNPIGKRFRVNGATGPWVQIVGVVKTSKYSFILETPEPFIYFPYKQRPQARMAMLVEASGDPSNLAAPMRDVVRRLDPNQPIENLRTLEETYRMRSITIVNVIVRLVAAMGVMGLALAVVGLYGLVSYAASRRTREIGIRMAIGAGRSDVLLMVLRQGLMLAISGLGVGLLTSVAAGRALDRAGFPQRPGGGPTDFLMFLSVAFAVFVVTLVAAYVPARRASRANPTDALRCE